MQSSIYIDMPNRKHPGFSHLKFTTLTGSTPFQLRHSVSAHSKFDTVHHALRRPATLRPPKVSNNQSVSFPSTSHSIPTTYSIGIAAALYGAYATNPSTAFDVVTYTTTAPYTAAATTASTHAPATPSTSTSFSTSEEQATTTYAIALITYTSAESCTAWELLSHIENQESPVIAAEKMLEDLRVGMGGVMGTSTPIPSSLLFLFFA
jgi:hypothetical protein